MQVQLIRDEAAWRRSEACGSVKNGAVHVPQWPKCGNVQLCRVSSRVEGRSQTAGSKAADIAAGPADVPHLADGAVRRRRRQARRRCRPAAALAVPPRLRESTVRLANRSAGEKPDDLLKQIDAQLLSLEKQKIDAAAARAYLQAIGDRAEAVDYEEARQLISAAGRR